jgi:anti-anti-sigma regulatory factor
MFLATIDRSKRLLLLSYIGKVRTKELEAGRKAAHALLADMPPGMKILADFGRLESMETAGAAELGRLMELADEKGVELVARVIPDPSKDIGLNILAAFHYRKPMQSVTCTTMEEAAKELGL